MSVGIRARVGLVWALVLLLVAAPATVLAGQHQDDDEVPGGDGDNRDDARHHNDSRGQERAAQQQDRARSQADHWQNLGAEKRAMAQERAEQARLFSLFEYADGELNGTFMSLSFDEADGTLSDVRVHDGNVTATTFTEVTVDPFQADGDPLVAGAVFHAFADNLTLSAHNNPTAQLRYTAGQATNVTFTLAEGLTHNEAGPALRFDTAEGPHFHMVLGDENSTLTVSDDNSTVEASLAPGASLSVLTHPSQASAPSANLHERILALEEENLGAEMSVVNANGTPASEVSEYGVSMRATRADNGTVEAEVESNETRGRAVILNVDEADLNGSAPEEITVSLDGQAIEATANARTVLEASPGTPAQFAVTGSEGALQVTVFVPGFSVHTLTVSQDTDTDTDADTDTDTSDGDTPFGDEDDASDPDGDEDADGPSGEGDDADPGQDAPGPGLLVVALVVAVSAALLAKPRADG